MIELSNQRPHTKEELRQKWPNCYVMLHSFEENQTNLALSTGVPYRVIEEEDLGVDNSRSSDFPQYSKKATISTFPIGPGLLSNYAIQGEDYDKQT